MVLANDITLGQYFPGNSFVHKLDPRTKLISVLAFMTGLLAFQSAKIFFLYLLVSIVIIVGSALPLRLVLGNLKPFIWLFALTILIHLFGSQGEVWFKIPWIGLTASLHGLYMGTVYAVRLALLIIIAVILTLSTSPIELTDGLDKLFSPLKRVGVPTQEIVMMLTLSLRFIPTLLEEAQRLKNAQISRGVSFEGSFFQRIKNIIPLVLPLFVSAFRRADELANAMDSRCYTIGVARTRYKQLVLSFADYAVMAGSFLILLLTFYL